MTLFDIAMIRQAEGRATEAVRLLEQVAAIDEAIGDPDLASARAALEEARQRLGAGVPSDDDL